MADAVLTGRQVGQLRHTAPSVGYSVGDVTGVVDVARVTAWTKERFLVGRDVIVDIGRAAPLHCTICELMFYL